MTHITCRLTAKNRDQLQEPYVRLPNRMFSNRVWATFTFLMSRGFLKYTGRFRFPRRPPSWIFTIEIFNSHELKVHIVHHLAKFHDAEILRDIAIFYAFLVNVTGSSAVTEGPRDAPCQLKPC